MIMSSSDEITLKGILQQLNTDQWRDLVTSLEAVRDYLRNTLPPDKEFRKLINRLHQLSGHPKWEVRRAVVYALACVADTEVIEIVKTLTEDSVPYVHQAAKQVLKNIDHGVTRISDKHYPTAEYLFSLVKKINPRNLRESYNAAVQVGQIHYRELARITAHEFRTSLLYFETLIDQLSQIEGLSNSEEGAAIIAKLQAALEHLARKMDRLIIFAEGPETFEVFGAGSLVMEAINEIKLQIGQYNGFQGDIIANGLETKVNVAGDRQRLKIAIQNLLSNAIEASPPDQDIDLSIEVAGEEIKVTIYDKGPGMDEQQMVNALKPFQSTKREQGGMGLGIPIAQRVIQDFGGELIFESEKGIGTKAIILLPVYREVK